MKENPWKNEFEAYRQSEASSPPPSILQRVQDQIHLDLKLTPWRVFSKLALIHLASALFTLSFCPQFGVRALGQGMGLMEKFMRFGEYGCMTACGFLFVGMSLLIAVPVLKPAELLAIRRHRMSEIGSLTLLSLGFFTMLRPEAVLVGFSLAWILGALAGGILFLEVGWRFRRTATA